MAKKISREVKTPKGMRDYSPEDMVLREKIMDIVVSEFKLHGAVCIDTPSVELNEVLQDNYGEEGKLIYQLKDQGGELCSLRYDLTVPFCRFMAGNQKYAEIKKYHIGKVYRRDNPATTKGRMREFYQCDFDIAGTYESMVPDAEVLKLSHDLLTKLGIGGFAIRLNHKGLLERMLCHCGVKKEQFPTICSAIDKLDKLSWEEVEKEMKDKGLDEDAISRIHVFVDICGDWNSTLEKLRGMPGFFNKEAEGIVREISTLMTYLEIWGITDKIRLDISLARGLHYYTGIIFEAVSLDHKGFGSIVGGGRYDNLVGSFSSMDVPCVGFSVGIERIFKIYEEISSKGTMSVKQVPTDVYVISAGGNLKEEKMKICSILWEAGISCEFPYKKKTWLTEHFNHCEDNKIPVMVLFGQDELNKGQVILKNGANRKEEGKLVHIEDLVSEVRQFLRQLGNNVNDMNKVIDAYMCVKVLLFRKARKMGFFCSLDEKDRLFLDEQHQMGEGWC